jgi:ribosomal protein S18 acetylase RimI-like enzyme
MTTTAARPRLAPPTGATQEAISILLLAFVTDPIIRWFLPAARVYREAFPALLGIVGGEALAASVDTTPQADGAAVWLPPGTTLPEEEVGALLVDAVAPDRHEEAFDLLGQMEAHTPAEAHHYLPFIGVDPRMQGRGIGSALLRVGLDRADRDGLPSYLEASSPRNRVLYERHGFEVVGEIRTATSPPLWPMFRPAA